MTSSTSGSSPGALTLAARQWIIALSVFTVCAFALTPTEQRRPSGHRLPYLQRTIEIDKPCIVMIGNSTLDDSTDPVMLSQLLNTTTEKVQFPGSATAIWYLYIKNVLTKTTNKPQYAIIFFRDNDLTNPDYRVTGNYRTMIQDLSDGEETTLRRLAPSFPQPFVIESLHNHFAFIRQRTVIRDSIEQPIRELLVPPLAGTTAGEAWRMEGLTFADERLNKELLTRIQLVAEEDVDATHYNFGDRVQASFLPLMHDMLREGNIRFIVVRLRRLRDALGKPEPEKLVNYMADLRSWLEERNIPLVDFTHDDRVTPDLFAVGDHLSKTKGMETFTPLLAERLAPLVTNCVHQAAPSQ
ncbi:hypothetical protein IT570_02525 [Candidatus Sumerlaeota bacterium]|nr:hypothetical protein [Candidatus Sumerlaeota bacterium]